MRKLMLTAALLLAIIYPTLAGEMHTGAPVAAPQPTPTPTQASSAQEPIDDATLDGEMATPGVSDILTETVLDLLAVLPSLL